METPDLLTGIENTRSPPLLRPVTVVQAGGQDGPRWNDPLKFAPSWTIDQHWGLQCILEWGRRTNDRP